MHRRQRWCFFQPARTSPLYRATLRCAAAYADRILRGASPAGLPVQLPTRFELSVNLKTAKALGITIPKSILAQADEAIQ